MAVPQGSSELGLSFQDVARIVRRRAWWFVVPALLGVTGSLALALGLPAVYEAAAVVTVEPQSISPELAAASIVDDPERRYNNLLLQMLSRESLSEIIDRFGLYPGEQELREVLIQRMREDDITIEPLPPAIVDPRKPVVLESFRIAFRSPNSAVVADVANELTRKFLGAHIELQGRMAQTANEFVTDELRKVREELERTRDRIRAYKEEHQGELPEELVVNTQRLERRRSERTQMVTQRDIARDQIGRIESEIEAVQRATAMDENDPSRRRDALELILNQHRAMGKTDKHPDVVQARAELETLEAMIEEKAADETRPIISPVLASLRRELRNHHVNRKVMGKQIGKLDDRMASIEQRIANTPRHTAELERLEGTALAFDRAIADLQLKVVNARVGEELVRDLLGEKFEVIEWAIPPEAPVSPNRPLWFVVGTILGVLFGVSILTLRELTDATFHTAGELQRATALPVLASVPNIPAPARRGRLRRTAVKGA